MTTNSTATKSALVDAVIKSADKSYALKTDEQIDLRAEIIKAAYTTARADYALKAKVYVYYVKEIARRGMTIENVLTFFKSEIDAQFESKKLRETSTDETTKEKVDAKAVYQAVRRMLTSARDEYSRDKVGGKGADQDKTDPLAAIRTALDKMSLVNIADAFYQLKSEQRKEDIIKAMFAKLTPDAKARLYIKLEETESGK